MLQASILALFMSFSPPNGFAAPYEFDPVTAEVSLDDAGTLEVLVFDAHGLLDGAMLASPMPDRVRFDASFGDGDVSFELVMLADGEAAIRSVELHLPAHIAEARINTMLGFADASDVGFGQITHRRCMIQFAGIAAVCATSAALSLGGAVPVCLFSLGSTFCECLPLMGYDPCN
jgi:hypothetical protein